MSSQTQSKETTGSRKNLLFQPPAVTGIGFSLRNVTHTNSQPLGTSNLLLAVTTAQESLFFFRT